MPLGSSAGRSPRHPVGDGASRRNTQRERDYVDPVREEEREEQTWRESFRSSLDVVWVGIAMAVLAGVGYVMLTALGVLLGVAWADSFGFL